MARDMARSWRDVRAEAVASGRVDPARVDAARRRMKAMEHAHTLAEVRGLRELVTSIERGLDRLMTSPAGRLRALRQELEREEAVNRHRVEARSRETWETLQMVKSYLRSLSNS